MPVEQRIFEVRRNFLAGKVELYTLDEPPVQVAFDASATPLPEDFAIMHCETGPEGLRVLGPVEAFARQLPAELRARLDAPPDGRPEIAVLACTRNVTQVEFERRCSELGVAGTHIHVRDVGVIAGFPRAFVVIPMNIVGAPPPTIVSAVNALVTFALVKLRAHLASEAAKPAGEWIIVADEAGPASDYREDVWAPTRMIFVAIPAASQLAFLGLGFHSMYNRESMRTALRDLLHEKRAVVYSFKWESGAPVGNVKSPYGGSAHWDLWRLCTALVLEDIVERHGAKDVTFLFEQVGALEPKSAAPVLELIKTFSRQEGRAGREAVKAAAHVLTKDGHPWLGYADACGMILRLPNEGEEALLRDVRKRTRDYPFDKANLERLGLVIEQAGAKPEVFLAAAAALPAGAVRMYGDVLEPALQAAAARLGKSAFPTVVERLVASLKSEPAAYAAVELVLKPIIRVETQFADVLAAFPALRYGFQFAKISIANHAAAVGDALKALAEWDALVAAGE